MHRSIRVAFLALLIILPSVSLFAEPHPKAAWPAYVLAIEPGFGLGQFYCCDANGVFFLITDFAGALLMAFGMLKVVPLVGWWELTGTVEPQLAPRDYSIFWWGVVISVASRILEVIDVGRAVDNARKAGRIADIVPTIDADIRRSSFEAGFLVRY